MHFPRKRTTILLCAALALLWLGWRVFSTFALDYASEHYLANGVVRVELPNGRKFNIPERYMFSQGFLVHGRWPKPKEGRVKVDYFHIDTLVPGLNPFREEERAEWERLGYGRKLRASVTGGGKDNTPTSWDYAYQHLLERVGNGHIKLLPDVGRLKAFLYSVGTKEKGINPYSTEYVSDDFMTKLSCGLPNTEPFKTFPSCHVRHIVEGRFSVSYYYSIDYFESWEKINSRLVELINGFERDALAEESLAEQQKTMEQGKGGQ